MGYYLLDNPPRRSQFRTARRTKPTGCIVVHSAENAPDIVPPDTGAESVANFIRTRTNAGSYHRLADSDSIVEMMPYSYEAFHDGTGSNPWSIGISAATKAAQWNDMTAEWRDKTITNMALAACDAALWLQRTYGIVVPAKRISRADSNAGKPGFISHGERDPGRRSDPGKDFPWQAFLERYAYFMSVNGMRVEGVVPPPPVAESPAFTGHLAPGQYLTSGNGRYSFVHQTDGNVVLYDNGVAIWASGTDGQKTEALVMQGDGNLVLYGGRALWATNTHNNPGAALRLQNDGNAVIYAVGNIAVWSSREVTRDRPVLRRGSHGDDVRYLQQRLRAHGYNVVSDGDFGWNTHNAVVAFQTLHGLTRDGVVGPKTWSRL